MNHQQCASSSQPLLEHKLERVKEQLASFGQVVIAFSGGVDSTLLATIARRVLGKTNVLAVTADSPSIAREDVQEAARLANLLDLQHEVIATTEVSQAPYRQNTEARCYFCKQELFVELETLAQARKIPVILYGAIGDDQLSERPGQQAACERGIRAPLQEAGLEKWEVRELARQLDLPNWDRPQNACLSSRIPHGMEVTEKKLQQIEAAEAFLRTQGFRQVRVRHLGTHARIEVGSEELARFNSVTLCVTIANQLKVLGFETVGVDRAGYHAGGADRHGAAVDEISLSAVSRC